MLTAPYRAVLAARDWIATRNARSGRRAQFARMTALRRHGRAFVLGNAPSLARLDLDRLDGEDYFTCNLAERIPWMQERTHPFYVAADKGVLKGYTGGRPAIAARGYFLASGLHPHLDADFTARGDVFFFAAARGGVSKRGLTPRPWISVANGQTILIAAVQIAWAMGYREIFILGCDLDYSGPSHYAYAASEAERARARDDQKMCRVANRQFAILREAIEARGGRLANAGLGGRLETLPRAGFDALFA